MKTKILLLGLVVAATSYSKTINGEFSTRLNESVITSERYEGTPLLQNDKNVTVITAEDIEKRGYKSVEEALEMAPSLVQIDGQISIRGQLPKLGERTMIVLLDGVPQNGMDNRAYELDFIPIDQVEQIEIVPAGGSIIYGGNATAGLINIISKNKEKAKFWGKASAQTGSFDKKAGSLTLGTKLNKKFDSSITYSADEKNTRREGEHKELTFFEFKNNYKLEDGKITLKYSHNEKSGSGRAKALTEEEYNTNKKQNGNRYNKSKDTQDKYILSFTKNITSKLETSGVVEYKERKYNYDSSRTLEKKKEIRDKNTNSFYTNAQLKYKYAKGSNIILGADYSKADVKEVTFNPIKKNKETKTKFEAVGGYLKNKTKYDNFIFTQGIRVEKNEFEQNEDKLPRKGKKFVHSYEKFSPTNVNFELATTYLLDEDKSVYLSYNQIKRSPSLTEYNSWNTDVTTEKKAQTSQNIEVGTKLLIENVYLSAATYFIDTKDEIMYDPSRSSTKFGKSFYNLDGKTQRYGLELAGEEYFDKITLRQSFTYMHNEITSGTYKGKEIPGIPSLSGSFGITYEPIENLHINFENKFYGRHYFANDFANEFTKYPGYGVANFSIKYNFDNGLALHTGVENIFDKQYADYKFIDKERNIKTKKYEPTKKFSPAAGRTFFIGFDYSF